MLRITHVACPFQQASAALVLLAVILVLVLQPSSLRMESSRATFLRILFPFWSSVGCKPGRQGLGGWKSKDIDGLGTEY